MSSRDSSQAPDRGDAARLLDLQRAQLDSVSVTTERAALDIVARLERIDGLTRTLATTTQATRVASAQCLTRARSDAADDEQTIGTLEGFVDRRAEAMASRRARLSKIIARTAGLRGHTDALAESARTMKILALNAQIEATRLGNEGEAFRVIASEMRAFAGRAEGVGRAVGEAIEGVAEEVDAELGVEAEAAARADAEEHAALHAVTGGIRRAIEEKLHHHERSAAVADELARVSAEIADLVVDALASVQFQDIVRQRLEHVGKALLDLSVHLVDGRATADLDALAAAYVSDAQREVHGQVTGVPTVTSAAPPAIELF
jgi:methyl-accepting chemotaxis protein